MMIWYQSSTRNHLTGDLHVVWHLHLFHGFDYVESSAKKRFQVLQKFLNEYGESHTDSKTKRTKSLANWFYPPVRFYQSFGPMLHYILSTSLAAFLKETLWNVESIFKRCARKPFSQKTSLKNLWKEVVGFSFSVSSWMVGSHTRWSFKTLVFLG